MSSDELRYSRQQALPAIGAAGQQRLLDARVLIIGMGGLGCPAAEYLAGAGIGSLRLNDFDTVDESNLARQLLYREPDVGKLKANVAAIRLQTINPDIETTALPMRMDHAALIAEIEQCDVVLDCSDNFATRWAINRACLSARIPLVSGAAIRMEGQLAVFASDGAGPCYQCLYDNADENLENCAGQGILGPVAGTVGAMMATETIKLILGIGSDMLGRLWIYDAAAGTSRNITINKRTDCVACGAEQPR